MARKHGVVPTRDRIKRRVEPRLLREFDLTLDWRGFELHPGTPRGGQSLSRLFPGVSLPALHDRTQRFAARFDVTKFTPPDVLSNTRRALAIAEFAREHGRLEPFRAAAFEAHWRQGKNLEDDGDLRAIATLTDSGYANRPTGNHAAIFDGYAADGSGFYVWDQWRGQPVHRRLIRYRGGKGSPSNDGDQFSVILTR